LEFEDDQEMERGKKEEAMKDVEGKACKYRKV
jgi:hypothetical protein